MDLRNKALCDSHPIESYAKKYSDLENKTGVVCEPLTAKLLTYNISGG
jgi:hypothetical protein